jgi:hypothetical protein
MGFVNAAGAGLKSSILTIPAGRAAFLTLTFAEGATSTTTADSRTRVNIRPTLVTVPPDPCRTVSSAEVFEAILGRTHLYAVPAEPPPDPDTPVGSPEFGVVAVTPLDTLRLNVTNITGSNGVPPDPCNVLMGFRNAAGGTIKTVSGTIEPGNTAFVYGSWVEAAGAALSTNAQARLNLHPFVNLPPDPCRVTASAELVNAATGETTLYILPAVQPSIAPPATVGGTTNGQ